MRKFFLILLSACMLNACTTYERYEYPSPEGRWIAIAKIKPGENESRSDFRLEIADSQTGETFDLLSAIGANPIGIDWRNDDDLRIYLCNAENVEMSSAPISELPRLSVTYETGFEEFCEYGRQAVRVPIN